MFVECSWPKGWYYSLWSITAGYQCMTQMPEHNVVYVSNFFIRIESYSCKMAGNDKQFYKRFNAEQGTTPQDLQALSPPQSGLGISPGLSQYRYY